MWPFSRNGTHSNPRRGSGPSLHVSSRPSGPRRPFFARNFDAASTGRLFADWSTSDESANNLFRDSASTLRARARDLERNNDLVNRFVQLMLANVVGPRGIRYQADVKDPTGAPDQRANALLEESFARWAVADYCSLDGRLSWPELQALLLRRFLIDGEVFLRLVRGASNDWGFALEPLDADLCDEQKNQQAGTGRPAIENGVEIDGDRRPVAYHFFANADATYSQRHIRVPADQIIHLYMPRRSRESRGVTPLAPVMRSIRMLDGYNYAKVVAARVSAAKMGFISSPDGGYAGAGENADGSTKMSAEPGEFEVMDPDSSFFSWDPDWPRDDDSFVKGIKRSIAAGLGVSYVSLASDLEGVNYSSIRQGELEQRDLYRVFQRMFIRKLCRRVHSGWLLMGLTGGAINLPISKIQKFRGARWQARGWQWVDPLKEIKAQSDAHALGTKSLTQIAAEQGEDLEEIFQQIQRDRELAAQYGVSIGSAPTPAPQPESPPDE